MEPGRVNLVRKRSERPVSSIVWQEISIKRNAYLYNSYYLDGEVVDISSHFNSDAMRYDGISDNTR